MGVGTSAMTGMANQFLQSRQNKQQQEQQFQRELQLFILKEKMKQQAQDSARKANLQIFQDMQGKGLFKNQNVSVGNNLSMKPIDDKYGKKPMSSVYLKNPLAEKPEDMFGFRDPQQMKGAQFQQDIGRFKGAQQEMSGRPIGNASLGQLRQAGKPDAKNYLLQQLMNRGSARRAMGELGPRFGGGRQITQDSAGKYQVGGVDLAERKFKVEQSEKKEVKNKQTEMVRAVAQDTLNTINKIETSGKGTGYFGLQGIIPPVAGSDKFTWSRYVNKLISSQILKLMNTMKQASRTGATGFGQLSEKELAILKDASTALHKGLKQEEAKEVLNNLKSIVNKILLAPGAVEDGYQYKGGDPSNSNSWEKLK